MLNIFCSFSSSKLLRLIKMSSLFILKRIHPFFICLLILITNRTTIRIFFFLNLTYYDLFFLHIIYYVQNFLMIFYAYLDHDFKFLSYIYHFYFLYQILYAFYCVFLLYFVHLFHIDCSNALVDHPVSHTHSYY
jgi:hypothetical protein